MTAFIIIATLLGVQILFWMIWLIAFSRDDRPGSVRLNGPPVSVIVCAHDEEQNLRELVPLLLGQEYSEFEIIIVEDRSNDHSYDYLLEATAQHPQLRMVRVTQTPEHINGKKFAITLGVKAARYEWLLFTDADCRPVATTWIRQMAAQMGDRKKLVLGFSPYVKKEGLLNAFIRFEAFVTGIQFMGFALIGKPYMGVGRNLAYRKSLFLESKGFNDYLGVTGGDDDLFVNAHGNAENVAVALGVGSLMRSTPKTTWSDFYYQKIRHLSVGKRYKFLDRLLIGTFAGTWVLSWLVVPPLVFFTPWSLWAAGLFVLRWICQILAFQQATRKLGEPFEVWKVPFLDFIYPFYYLVAGTVATVSKKVRWKKN